MKVWWVLAGLNESLNACLNTHVFVTITKKLLSCLSSWIPFPMIITSALVKLIISPQLTLPKHSLTVWQHPSRTLHTHSCPLQLPSAIRHPLTLQTLVTIQSADQPLKTSAIQSTFYTRDRDTSEQHLMNFNTKYNIVKPYFNMVALCQYISS